MAIDLAASGIDLDDLEYNVTDSEGARIAATVNSVDEFLAIANDPSAWLTDEQLESQRLESSVYYNAFSDSQTDLSYRVALFCQTHFPHTAVTRVFNEYDNYGTESYVVVKESDDEVCIDMSRADGLVEISQVIDGRVTLLKRVYNYLSVHVHECVSSVLPTTK